MRKKIVDVDQVLLEELVLVDKYKKEVKLVLTPNRIIFQIKKGFFKKVYKEVEVILLSDVEVLDGKVCVSRKRELVLLGTVDDRYEIIFEDKKAAKEFEVLVTNTVSGTKPIGRAISKFVDFVQTVNDSISPETKKLIGSALLTFAGAVVQRLIEENTNNDDNI